MVSELQVKEETSQEPRFERFDGRGDYTLWKRKLLAQLEVMGISDALKEKEEKKEAVETERVKVVSSSSERRREEHKKDHSREEKENKARSVIILSVADNILRRIRTEETAAGMISVLDKLYLSDPLSSRISLKRKLFEFKMSENKAVEENIEDFFRIVEDLEKLDVYVSDEDKAFMLLLSLPRKLEQLKYSLDYCEEPLTLGRVMTAIYKKELEVAQIERQTEEEEKRLSLRERERSDYREEQAKGKEKVRSEAREKKGPCWRCGQKGHVKTECFQEKKNKSRKKSVRYEESSAQSIVSGGSVFMVSEAAARASKGSSEEWICDTGCTSHMSSRKEWFEDLVFSESGNVSMANDTTLQVKGIGSVRILNDDGTTVLLTNVMYIPGMSKNLISLGTLENKGCWFKSKNGILKVIKGCITLMKAEKVGTLYMLKGKAVTARRRAVQGPKEETKMEHIKPAHMSQTSLEIPVKKGCIRKQKIGEVKVCEDRAQKEVKRIKFDSEKIVTEMKPKIVHSKIWSFASTPRKIKEGLRIKGITAKETGKSVCDTILLKSCTGGVDIAVNLKKSLFSSSFEVSRDKETSSASNCRKLVISQDEKFQRDIICECCQEHECERRKCVSEKGIFSLHDKNELVYNESVIQGGASSSENSQQHSSLNSHQVMATFMRSRKEEMAKDGTYHHSTSHQVSMKRSGVTVYAPSSQRKPSPRERNIISVGCYDGEIFFKILLPEDKEDCFIRKNAEFLEGYLIKVLNLKFQDLEDQRRKSVRVSLKSLQDYETSSFQVQGGAYSAKGSFISEGQESLNTSLQGRDAASETSEEETDLQGYLLTRINVKREVQPSKKDEETKLVGSVQFIIEDAGKTEPTSFEEEKRDPSWSKVEEIQFLHNRDTWDLADKLMNQEASICKGIYKKKPEFSGIGKPSFKVNLRVKGHSKEKVVLKLMEMKQKTDFLHENSEKNIRMLQPAVYEEKSRKEKAFLLENFLYGLKNLPRSQNQRNDTLLIQDGYMRSKYVLWVYFKVSKMEIHQNRGFESPRLSQEAYVIKVIRLFKEDQCEFVFTSSETLFEFQALEEEKQGDQADYMKLISCLSDVDSVVVAIIGTRVNIAWFRGVVFRSKKEHWKSMLRRMRGIKGTTESVQVHRKQEDFELTRVNDSKVAVGADQKRVLTCRSFTTAGSSISCKYMFQEVDFVSTKKGERNRWTGAYKRVVWVRDFKDLIESSLVFKKQEESMLRGCYSSKFAAGSVLKVNFQQCVFSFAGNTLRRESGLLKVGVSSTTEAEKRVQEMDIQETVLSRELLDMDTGGLKKTTKLGMLSSAAGVVTKGLTRSMFQDGGPMLRFTKN
ncbi:retroelement pol polyprotein-like [Arabidopsis thaliana]|uniref:Retroelement pol polyprotein-like n=1 Tax=Arabidopsis thaliana TaxID=3702 RepID=Q9LS18_ARATH|nr:retroelement pol polyprotein-like [Arabidopsis thaliana]